MQNKKYYYDEEIKNFYFNNFYGEFIKVKEELVGYELKDLLLLQTKTNLIDIAKRLEIKGYSKLGKDKLVDLVSETIKGSIGDIVNMLTYKEVEFLKVLMKKKESEFFFNVENLTSIGGLTALGIVHRINKNDKYYLVVAEEFKTAIRKKLKDDDYLNSLINRSIGVAYIDGVMSHYGLVFGADLYKLICESDKEIFKEDADYFLEYLFRSYEAFTTANSFIHPFMFSPEDIAEELRVRQTIEYNFNQDDLFIDAGRDYKNQYTEALEKLKDILIEKKIKVNNIDATMYELMYYIKNDLGTMSIVKFIENLGIAIEEKDSAELVEVLARVFNTTPMWVLKGLTPMEIEARRKTTVVKEKEPGRNEPCPCGSGKKYKKCCGR